MIRSELKKAVAYCRVSDTKKGRRGDGLHSQQRSCEEFARAAGYRIDKVFFDDMTGGVIDRPAMKEMIKYLKANDGCTVIIDSIDRFARDVRGHWDLRDLLREAGGMLVSPKMEFKDDADSMMVENIHATFAQHFRQKNAEQTSRRMRARLMNGYAVFQAPIGYIYVGVHGRGRMLQRHEPLASVVQEALEGYASGRFDTQADVMRFLQDHPTFPKGKAGNVRAQRVTDMLTQCVYAGFVEAPNWGIPLRQGHHEPLISVETYRRIQDRLNGINRMPSRKNLRADFPLRGFVVCADCGTPLTACWSKGQYNSYAYYLCPKKGCPSYRKSTRREKLEGEFEALLGSLRPSEKLFKTAYLMLKRLWDHRLSQADTQRKALAAQIQKVEHEIDQFLARIVETSVTSVVTTYEKRISNLEIHKLALQERLENFGKPKSTFDQIVRTALWFLGNPGKLWASERFEYRQMVLKMAFPERLRYSRNEGLRTADLALPFKLLGEILGGEKAVARPKRFELLTF